MKLRGLKLGQNITLTTKQQIHAETDKVLWQNEWMRVILKDGWYTCSESTVGHGVSVLVFKPSTKQVLVRYEHCPCHGEGLRQTSLTGTIDEDETPDETAIRELKEESGIDATLDELIPLGWVYQTKQSSDKLYMFAVDGDNKEIGAIVGDGTKGEEGAYVEWLSLEAALQINAPSVLGSLAKLCAMGKIKL